MNENIKCLGNIKYLNYDLVIIGGGSAGLASAISAYDNGIKSILVLEKDKYLGGILLQCIHNGFGLTEFKEELAGPEYAQRFIDKLENREIEYKLSSMVLKIEKVNDSILVHYSNTIDGYKICKAKAIICATGCSERTRGAINISGTRPSGIMTAGLAQRYLNIEGYMIGRKVFILGSGDIGLIMARRLKLEGAEVLGVAELMPYSNGLNRNIVQCLKDYDIPLYLHHTVKEIIGKKRVEKVVICEVDDNLQFIEGKEKIFDVDTLLLSVGLIPSNPLLEELGVKMYPRTKGPIVDENLETSIDGIFACGNSLHVHDLVDFVSQEGRVAGRNAALYIQNKLPREENNIIINPLNGIGYVLPLSTHSLLLDRTVLKFRVKKPYNNCYIDVKVNGTLVKSIKKLYLLPAEMENIQLSNKILEDIEKCDKYEITLEVRE